MRSKDYIESVMISQLNFEIHDSRGRVSIRYSKGVRTIEYDAIHKKLKVLLNPDYVCEDKEIMRNFNVSCEPYHHTFYDVELLSLC